MDSINRKNRIRASFTTIPAHGLAYKGKGSLRKGRLLKSPKSQLDHS